VNKKIEIPSFLQKPKYRFAKVEHNDKKPKGIDWNTKGGANYSFNDKKLTTWLTDKGNYGVLTGKLSGSLVVIDADKQIIQETVEKFMPKTTKVKTGRKEGGYHYYYYTEKTFESIKLKDQATEEDLGDVFCNTKDGKAKMAIGASSIHKSGNQYELETFGEPVKITREKIISVFNPWISKENEKIEIIKSDSNLKIGNLVDKTKLKMRGQELQGEHPIHGSKENNWNFCINEEKNTWHCFRCGTGGGTLSWIAVKEGIIKCDESQTGVLKGELFLKTLKIAKEKYGYKETVIETNKEIIKNENMAEEKEEWEFKNYFPKEHFISQYIGCGTELSDAYPEYFLAGALNLLSTAADRGIRIDLTPKAFYTNLWFMLVGKSTVSRKTTAINLNSVIMNFAGLEDKLTADDATPEAFIDELKDNAKASIHKDEFGLFLAKARRKYQSGIDALLSKLYDSPDHYKRRLRKETIELKNVYISLLGGFVPEQIAQYALPEDIQSGFFPRMLFVFPERPKQRKKHRILTVGDEEKEKELGDWLGQINELILSVTSQGLTLKAIPSEEGLNLFEAWCESWENYILTSRDGKDFAPFFGRASVSALKMAALIELGSKETKDKLFEFGALNSSSKTSAFLNYLNKKRVSNSSNISNVSIIRNFSSDFDYECNNITNFTNFTNLKPNNYPDLSDVKYNNSLVISRASVELAIFYVSKLFLPCAKKVIDEVNAKSGEAELERIYKLALKHSRGGCVEHSDLLRKSNVRSKDFLECVKTLQESGRFYISDNAAGKRVYTPLRELEGDVKMPY